MSINITVHGNHVAPTNDINCFRDLQTLRKETFAKKRISRIKQVREQSKDVASRLRRRVHNEEEKQLFRIRDTQENELKSWKERHIKKLKDHYESRLNTFGEAHLNAEREKQAEKMAEERALAQATAARKRRKSAALKLKDCHFKALPKVVMKLPASPNKNVATQADLEIKAKVPAYEELELPPSNSVIDLSSDDSSILTFQPNRSSYDPANYAGDSTSESISIVLPATQDPLSRQPFTQVSDFLKKRQWERQLENLQDTNQQPNKSPVKISKPTDQQQQKKVVRSPVKSTLPSKSSLKGKENLSKKSLKSSTTPTKKPTVPKVTYYDHTTRFTKEYDMPGNLVVRNAPTAGEQNAYEAASDLKRVEQEERAAEQRKRSHFHPEVALQKEKIRRDYESLAHELAALQREETNLKTKAGFPQNFSADKAKQQAEEREKQLNDAVERLLRQHVTITCPKVTDISQPPSLSTLDKLLAGRRKVGEVNVGTGGFATRFKPADSADDSCQSIILGPTVKKVDGEADQYEKLIKKIEEQQKILEATKPATFKATEDKDKLKKRERELEERERKLEIKANELYTEQQRQKQKQKIGPVEVQGNKEFLKKCIQTVEDSSTTSESSSSLLQSTSECPVQIIIKVNKPHRQRTKSQRTKHVQHIDTLTKPGKVYPKTPRPKPKRPDMINKEREFPTAPVIELEPTRVEREVPKAPVIEPEVVPPRVEISPESSMATTSASTMYRSPPSQIGTKLTELLKEKKVKVTVEAPPKSMNPFLVHYIQKLLSMSRTSIDNLGVSSSDVPTPSDTVVNVSENISPNASLPPELEEARYNKLKKFIDDNYNFLDEIEETLSRSGPLSSLNGTFEENVDRVEEVWARVLDHKEREMQKTLKEQSVKSKTPPPHEKLKPVLKRPTTAAKLRSKSPPPRLTRDPLQKKTVPARASFPPTIEKQEPHKEQTVIEKVKPILKSPKAALEASPRSPHNEQILEKYAELTKNCSKRIADLAEMINKVREEKQRLVNASLSSPGTAPSSNRPDSTEYFDFPLKRSSPLSADLSKATNAEDQPSEEITNIFKSHTRLRQMGVSKDSGISMMSRPVTSSDFRDSPKTTEPVPTFEPLLKDIPKITTQFKVAANQQPREVLDLQTESGRKANRPPAALTRYSPQLEPEQAVVPHELSTILEIETPANSRFSFNQSRDTSKPSSAPEVSLSAGKNSFRLEITDTSDHLTVENFGNFEDYCKQMSVDVVRKQDGEFHVDFRKVVDITNKSDELSLKEMQEKVHLVESSSSSGSLPDVVAELKARNMPYDFESSKVYNQEILAVEESMLPEKEKNIDKSVTTSQDLSVRQFYELKEVSGVVSLPHSEGSDTLEQDLSKMGLQWAASMMKKTKESQTLPSSSSSSSPILESSRRMANASKDSTNTSHHLGRALNLREFLTRELMIRTHSDSNSLTDDSSLSSQFLKSLLNLNTLSSPSTSIYDRTPIRQQAPTEKATPHRTSTPVASSKLSGRGLSTTDEGGNSSPNISNDLFSGESRLSSVKKGKSTSTSSSSTSGDNTISSNKFTPGLPKQDDLLIPGLKLRSSSTTTT